MSLKELKIGNLTVNIPIIQGGMGVGISLSSLASAVANEGGVGVISAAGIGFREKDYYSNFLEANIRALKKEIRRARELTKGILGVNIMVALSNYADMVKTAIDEGIDIIFSGAGLPLNLPQFLKGGEKTKLVPIVSSSRAAGIIAKRWTDKYNYLPDAVVVEGPLAGGHLGYQIDQLEDPKFSLENVTKEVIHKLKEWGESKIPVIAGGGVYSGSDVRKILDIGADGVQMATRFVATHECDATDAFKNVYLNAKKEDIQIIESPVGMPGRAVKNSFLQAVKEGLKHPVKCPYHCILTCKEKESPYCIAMALANAQKGNMTNGFAFAGANVHRLNKIISVKELFQEILKEYSKC